MASKTPLNISVYGRDEFPQDQPNEPLSKPAFKRRFGTQTPAAVCGLIAAALGFAIGHHFYYQSLSGTVVQSEDQQAWSIRLGTGAAVLTKTSLVALIGIAAVQRIWATLRRKSMTLGGIDAVFGIMGDPTWFFSGELLGHAKILVLLAVVSWCIPLITIITPATLSVQPVTTSAISPASVRTVNFTHNEPNWFNTAGAGRITSPGAEISRFFTQVYVSRRVTPIDPPSANASYDLSFWGPSYKCSVASELFESQNDPTWNISDTSLGPLPKTLRDAFYAELPATNKTKNRFTFYQGSAPTYMNNMILLYAAGGPSEVICQLYNTSFELSMNFINGNQTITPRAITPLAPAAFDSAAGSVSLLSSLSAGASNDVLATFYATHLLFSNLLATDISMGADGEISFKNLTLSTDSLVDSAIPYCPDVAKPFAEGLYFLGPAACRNGTLARAVEDLSRNFTMSTLAYPFWDDGNATTTVEMKTTFPQNRYTYQWRTLVITYSVGFAVTALCLALGLLAMKENGVTSSTAFSTVMLTTRNPDLDVLASGRWLGSKPLSNDIAKVKMRFGWLADADGESPGHVGFGLDGTVVPIEKT
ncbi:hypothetical protein QBC47DRAFT_370314 [Echria macrotheca]|uniref:Uncharacterized protein n=1 Tax=Echria macrotheca TaxID=438768 RepID=A0AAJ0BNZ3_9PEZI|nr:hypothetical protein QBC47DRAFT_370314 [Echria macrotheca]